MPTARFLNSKIFLLEHQIPFPNVEEFAKRTPEGWRNPAGVMDTKDGREIQFGLNFNENLPNSHFPEQCAN